MARTSRKTAKYGEHSIHVEWQSAKSCDFQFREVYNKGVFYGELRKQPDGTVEYWAARRPDQRVRLVDNGWAIDKSTIALLRIFTVKVIGVQVDNGDRYWMALEDFMTHKVDWNWAGHIGTAPGAKGKEGAAQWAVGQTHWQCEVGKPETMLKRIMIKGKWGK